MTVEKLLTSLKDQNIGPSDYHRYDLKIDTADDSHPIDLVVREGATRNLMLKSDGLGDVISKLETDIEDLEISVAALSAEAA